MNESFKTSKHTTEINLEPRVFEKGSLSSSGIKKKTCLLKTEVHIVVQSLLIFLFVLGTIVIDIFVILILRLIKYFAGLEFTRWL